MVLKVHLGFSGSNVVNDALADIHVVEDFEVHSLHFKFELVLFELLLELFDAVLVFLFRILPFDFGFFLYFLFGILNVLLVLL